MAEHAADDVPMRTASTGSLARGGAAWLLANVLGGAALVVIDAWSGRVLGPHAYGAYGALRRVAQFAGFVVLMGLENVVVRHVAVAASPDAARRVERAASIAVSVVGGVLGGALALSADRVARAFQLGADGPEAVRWMAASLPLAAVRMVAVAAAQGRGHARIRPFVMSILWPATLALAVLVVAAAWMPGTPLVAMMRAWVAALALGCAWALVALARLRHEDAARHGVAAASGVLSTPVPAMAAMAWPLWLHGLAMAACAWTDHLVLSAVHGPAGAAAYGPVAALGPVYGMALVALSGPLAPMLAARHAAGDREGLGVLFRTSARWAFLLSALPVVVTLVAPDALLRAWPDITDPSVPSALRVAATAQWVGVGCGSVNYVLVMTGRAGAVWWGAGTALAVSLLGSWLLVPPYGALGAAVANGVALIVANVVGARVVARCLGVSVFDTAFARACVAMGLPVAAGLGAAQGPLVGWGRLACVCTVVLLAWVPATWWWGLEAGERDAVRHRLGRYP